MYFWEINNLLKNKGYRIGGDDLLKIISVEENPQINHIIYNPFDNSYDIWDIQGNHFHFSVIPFEETREKTKSLKK